jgi:hypothetical protein
VRLPARGAGGQVNAPVDNREHNVRRNHINVISRKVNTSLSAVSGHLLARREGSPGSNTNRISTSISAALLFRKRRVESAGHESYAKGMPTL